MEGFTFSVKGVKVYCNGVLEPIEVSDATVIKAVKHLSDIHFLYSYGDRCYVGGANEATYGQKAKYGLAEVWRRNP
jgi:hypothetical protein